jgi:putative oxygen-independent coproporphyrinogen III oxidase
MIAPADPAVSEARSGLDRFGLYVHWPFCVSKCPYCDFNSHVAGSIDAAQWTAALCAELDHFAIETKGRRLGSVFFGGGTPSLMPPETVAAILDRAAAHWELEDDIEITLEANPSSVEAGKFKAFRTAGINRVSIGVQAFDDDALRFLGRAHDSAAARHAVSVAERAFERMSFDLIYGLPGQSLETWRRSLDDALAIAGDHLSLYQLTIEKGTPFFAAHRSGAFVLPDEDTAADLFEITAEIAEKAGLPAYEISNHARPGSACRHNLVYWQGGDYAGIGPGAHGRLRNAGVRRATRQIAAPGNWLAAVASEGHGTQESAVITVPEQIEELLLTGLRLADGIIRSDFEIIAGNRLELVLLPEKLDRLAAAGLLVCDARGLRLTAGGRLRHDAIVAALVPPSGPADRAVN